MSNLTIKNEDMGGIVIGNPQHEDALLTFESAGTETAGTLLGRVRAVSGAVTPGGNTGTGTVTGFALAEGDIPKPGSWILECIATEVEGGTFKLTDPDGNIVANNLKMAAAAGASTTFIEAGMTFIITDAATDFAAGDTFTLAVTASDKMKPYDSSAVDGTKIPIAILEKDTTAAAAGDISIRPILRGKVRLSKILVKSTGQPPVQSEIDALRDYGIIAINVSDKSVLDNQ